MDFPNSALWNYSTQIWALPDVEAICLDLQNSHDIDVNMLLYCCWVGDKNLCLNEDDLQILLDTTQPWLTIIKPLRESRKMMKNQNIAMPASMVEQTVSNITEMEINAEHMALLAMEKALKPEQISASSDQTGIECSLANIKTYLASLENTSLIDAMLPQISQLLTVIKDNAGR